MNNLITDWNPDLYNDKHSFVYQYGYGLIELLAPQKNERILDLGCGAGQLTNEISKKAVEVVGIDKSVNMIKDAKRKFTGIEFYATDAANFMFEKPFDAIFSNAALHWMLEKEKVVNCMYKNLKMGGRLVLEMGGKGNIQSILNALKEELVIRKYQKNANTILWYFPSISEYSSILEEAGFEVNLAQLFDRPTLLDNVESGVIDWLNMFCNSYLHDIPFEEKEDILNNVQKKLKDTLLIDSKWYADYKRLRIMATKK